MGEKETISYCIHKNDFLMVLRPEYETYHKPPRERERLSWWHRQDSLDRVQKEHVPRNWDSLKLEIADYLRSLLRN